MIAQQLYEGIELPGEGSIGLITYMRTDSTRVSEQALDRSAPVHYRNLLARLRAREVDLLQDQEGCADAHEAIRRPRRLRNSARRVCAPPHAGPVLPLQADLESFRRVADAAGHLDETTVDVDASASGAPSVSSGSRARCRSSPAGWRSTTRSKPEAADRGAGTGCGHRRGRGRIEPAAAVSPKAIGSR